LADGFGGHGVALGEDAGALVGAGDLGAGDGRGAGVRMDLQHRSDLPLSGLDQTVEQVAVGDNSMPHRIPTMLRDLTVMPTMARRSAWPRPKASGAIMPTIVAAAVMRIVSAASACAQTSR